MGTRYGHCVVNNDEEGHFSAEPCLGVSGKHTRWSVRDSVYNHEAGYGNDYGVICSLDSYLDTERNSTNSRQRLAGLCGREGKSSLGARILAIASGRDTASKQMEWPKRH